MNQNNLLPAAAEIHPAFLKNIPASRGARTTTGTAPYTGVWTKSEVLHLLRRTMFGAAKADVDYFLTKTMSQAVDELLTASASVPAPPLKIYTDTDDDAECTYGQSWVATANYVNVNGKRKASLQGWWIGQLLNQGRSIEQQMTLFWHNHFSTELNSYADARYGYKYLELIRSNALGNFKTLTTEISKDPAMLKYLNGSVNTKNAPDENYGRELQELFTVGKGVNSLYTEDDVKAAARVMTGYRINNAAPVSSYFDTTKHDTNPKVFSSFYGNTVINNTGNGGADELNDLMNMLFSNNEVALFICRKLYRYFVYYDIDATVETNVIEPLAVVFRDSNYDIKAVLSVLFKSEHFFDMVNRGCLIKPPLDFLIGVCREFNVVFPDATVLTTQYGMWKQVQSYALLLQQDPLNPPNVAGWAAYYQTPKFHELWINTSTLPSRNYSTDLLLGKGGVIKVAGVTLAIDTIAYVSLFANPEDPDLLINDVAAHLLALDISQTTHDYLKAILLKQQTTASYWTTSWNNYQGAPTNTAYKNEVLGILASFFQTILSFSEYQLS